MDIRLLGPVELRVGNRVVEAGPVRQRAVLAALAVDVGRPVMMTTLVDRVWDDVPPVAVRPALYAYVSRLRRLLSEAGECAGRPPVRAGSPIRMAGHGGGYVLEVDPRQVDLHRFRGLVAAAGCADIGAAERAQLLHEALGLWSGVPLADLPGEWAARTRAGLQHERLEASVGWARIELRLGRPAQIIGPIRQLLGEFPLAESLAETLMRALAIAGRDAEAVHFYAIFRAKLADGLGVEPGARLRELHQALLRGELNGSAQSERVGPADRTPAAAAVVPAQLPVDVFGFVGRAREMSTLNEHLTEPADESTAAAVSAVSGEAGVGKTALAVHWAHRMRGRFPDGQLYVDLHGYDPTGSAMTPSEAIRGFLDALGVTAQQMPAGLDAQVGLYRSLMARRRMLVVLDNARTAEQVRPLLPGGPSTRVLVASRQQLASLVALDGARPITLDLLPPLEARELLARRLGTHRLTAEPLEVDEIVERCAGLPLALAVVAARAVLNPAFPLKVLADELRAASNRLAALADGEAAADVRAVFSWSYRTLTSSAAALFRLLGLHPGPDISTAAAASLAGVPPSAVRPLLAELAGLHLIIEHAPARYTFHDLLRLYARHLANTQDADEQRRAAVHRVMDHYLHTAHRAALLLQPARQPITLAGPVAGVTVEVPADGQQALAWFATELPVLLDATRHAADTGLDVHTWQLAWTLAVFLDRRGYWRDLAEVGRAALAAAQRLADRPTQARAHRNLAHAYSQLGQLDDAHRHQQQGLDLSRQAGDEIGQARSHLDLSRTCERQDDYHEALRHAWQALSLYRAAGHRQGQAHTLNGLGWLHAQLGHHQQSIASCQQALALHQEIGDRHGQAATLDSIGYAHHRSGEHTQAVADYQRALDLYRELGDRYEEAETLIRLGESHHAAGDTNAAGTAWQLALTILDELDHPNADRVRKKLLDLCPS